MSPQEENDPLSDLLSGVVLPPADPVRREAIFAATRGLLKRRRLVRRGIWTTAFAACYLAGVLSVLGWQWMHPRNEIPDRPIGVIGKSDATLPEMPNPSSEPPSNPPSEPQPEPQSAPSSDEAPNAIAQSKPAQTLTTFEKLRRAGDRQLNERGNLEGAIGCYRRALDFASDDDLRIVPERDSWLFISLKEDRLEVRKHVHKKS